MAKPYHRWVAAIALALISSVAVGDAYGPVRSGDSLWSLYGGLGARAEGERFAWLIATQSLNPAAFSHPCNGNSLKVGARLDLPSRVQVEAVAAEEAHQEYQRQAAEWKARGRPGQRIGCSDWFQGLKPRIEAAGTAATTAPPAPVVAPASPVEEKPVPAAPLTPVAAPAPPAPAAPQNPPVPPVATTTPPPVIASAPSVVEKPVPPATLTTPSPVKPPAAAPSPSVAERPTPVAPAPAAQPSAPAQPYLAYSAAALAALLLALGGLFVLRRRRIPAKTGTRTDRPTNTYSRRILVVVTLVVVAGQLLFAVLNVQAFQQSYLQSVQTQSLRLADYLRQDVEYVLGLGIPLQKLVKIESSLAEILHASPEIEFLEITDREQRVIYYADHHNMKQYGSAGPLSMTLEDVAPAAGLFRIGNEETDLRLPVSDPKTHTEVGFIQMRISAQLIQHTSGEIVWDIATVILVSLLITFEFLSFFVSRGFSDPLRRLTERARAAFEGGCTLPTENALRLSGIGALIGQINQWIERAQANRSAGVILDPPSLQRAQAWLDGALARGIGRNEGDADPIRRRITERLLLLRGRVAALRLADPATSRGLMASGACREEGNIPYHYIRPFVFLFFIAYNLPVSFFPMFVKTFEQPPWGLSAPVLIGLPISIFMFFFAISMLVVGRWLDRSGWFRPLLWGAGIFMGGFLLTALAEDYLSMVLYRSITAVGLGIGFMGFQQFVVANTRSQDRNVGLASFLGAFFAGEIVGTVIGGMLADRLGYANIFLLSGLLSGLSLLGIFVYFRRSATHPQDARETPRLTPAQLFGALRDREFLAVVVFQAIPAKIALVGFLMYFVPLYLAHVGALQSDIGRIAMSYGLMLVVIGPLISRYLARPTYRKYYVMAGGLITGGAMIAFAVASNSVVVFLMVAALGIAHALSLSSQAALIAETRLVNQLGLGTGMGVYRFWERIGSVAGPFIMGALIATAGYEQAVVTLGIGIILSSLIYILLLRGIQGREDTENMGLGQNL